MYFTVVGGITHAETFATGSGIREIARLRKLYGRGRWRKRKGFAQVRLAEGPFDALRYTGMKPAALAAEN